MSSVRLSHLPLSIQKQIIARYGDLSSCGTGKSGKVRHPAGLSPYADALKKILDTHFPDQFVAEYKPYPDSSGRKYRIDFAHPSKKVGIEFDGYRYHGLSKTGFKTGLARQNLLVSDGWRMLRYTLTDVRDRADYIVQQVQKTLNAG